METTASDATAPAPAPVTNWPDYLTSGDAVRFIHAHGLPYSQQTLANWRIKGRDGGRPTPRFHKLGAFVSYPRLELEKWIEAERGPLVERNAELLHPGRGGRGNRSGAAAAGNLGRKGSTRRAASA